MSAPDQSYAPPPGWANVRVVGSFTELVTTSWAGGVNALCWPRTLSGDFAEIVARVAATDGIVPLDDDALAALPLSAAGIVAREILREDLHRLREHGLAPSLDVIAGYPRDADGGPVPTDVYSFHADSAPVAADTYLCTYHGATSEILRNEDAVRRIDVPATRAELLALYGGVDDAGFAEFLHEHCYDLHYTPVAGARPLAFQRGHLWRLATEWPGCPVPPCVHRAPTTAPGEPPRLLLIS